VVYSCLKMPRRLRIAFTDTSPPVLDNWSERSAGAIVAVRFNSQSDVDLYGELDAGFTPVSFDSSSNGDGTSGSLKLTVSNYDGAPVGQVKIPFGEDIPDDTTFYVSMRIYQDYAHAYSPWAALNGAETDSKYFMVSDTTGTVGDVTGHAVVIQGGWNYNFLAPYHWNGNGTDNPWDVSLSSPCGADILKQHTVDNDSTSLTYNPVPGKIYPLTGLNPDSGVAWTPCEQFAARRGPNFRRKNIITSRKGLGDWLHGGMRLEAGEWMTVMLKIQFGHKGLNDTHLTLYVQRQGDDDYTKVNEQFNQRVGEDDSNPYNCLWILNYCTNRLAQQGKKITDRSSPIPGVTIRGCGNSTAPGVGTLRYVASTQKFQWKNAVESSFGTAVGFSEANELLRRIVPGVNDKDNTTTTSALTWPVTTIPVASTSTFASSGYLLAAGFPCSYSGTTATSFTGVAQEITLASPAGSIVRQDTNVPQQTVTTTFIADFLNATTIPVEDTSDLDFSGQVYIGAETVTYTGKTATSLTGCSMTPITTNNGSQVIIEDYLIIEIDPVLLPTSGTHDESVTIATGRVDTYCKHRDAIVSYSLIPPTTPY
jgi:hypothetical protein